MPAENTAPPLPDIPGYRQLAIAPLQRRILKRKPKLAQKNSHVKLIEKEFHFL
jgi:hypothetical protein